jgi:hypothetical protein
MGNGRRGGLPEGKGANEFEGEAGTYRKLVWKESATIT